ncbi:CU044_5270 family protein [Actinomadura alba]|uniref:CU044_5270 family protein n=1 Tax=Actinomadura alba TaxID=406431 RepID=A0ABR7LNF4_9ACTN|nr:CU044_5270 family protein [Actinomadura alba]MBC6465943.1 CU044_5270 family protein [Actinomadura alba]
MDELDALRQMRTALAEQEHPDRIALRTSWRADVKQRPRRSFRIPLVSLAATAAVAAGAVVAVSLAPSESSAPGPGKNGAVPQKGNVLLVAATNAEKAPIGKYWHTRTISGEIHAVGKSAANHYKVDSRQGSEVWTDRSGKGRQGHLDLPDVPLTAQDKQKWEAAGSPNWVRIPDAEGAGRTVALQMNPPAGRQAPFRMPANDRFFGLTTEQIAELPTQPKALEKALLSLEGNWHAYTTKTETEPIRALRGQERVRALSDVAGTLLSTAPAPPKVRAAAFRMLAALPGVKAEGEATDPAGRIGTVISLPLETTMPLGLFTAPKQLGTYRRQWIINPVTGKLLAIRDLVATPPRGSRKLPTGDDGKPRSLTAENMPDRFHRPGEVAAYQVFEVTEWTNAEPPR